MTSSTTMMNGLVTETPAQEYMREYADYLDHAIDFPQLSQIRQLDISLQDSYRRIRELTESSSQSQSQTTLINLLVQIKAIGDKKMQLSQQMLDVTERQSRKLKLAQQKYIESVNADNNSNEVESDNEDDSETGSQRSLSTKSLWKRKTTNSTQNFKRKCPLNVESNVKKPFQRTINSNSQTNTNKKLRLNHDSSSSQSDETTYCLCSQLSYGSMILCDNKTCDIKWFHFNCVNLTTKPKGKWFCPMCRENRN